MNRVLELCRGIGSEAGFDPEIVDSAILEAAIRRRLLATGITELEEYLSRLSASSAERQELLEELLVRESWFFRDDAPFRLLGRIVRERWLTPNAERPLRVLSAPCAGGEEPYSISMVLADAGLSMTDYEIDAVDLSRRGLEIARLARYGRNAVRHVPASLQGEYLDFPQANVAEVRASLRESVRLHWGNLLDLPESLRNRRYQVIFCRNVLIYLGTTARERVLAHMAELLAPDGVLVVGHAESGLMVGRAWEPLGGPGTFAFEPRHSAVGDTKNARAKRSQLAPRSPTVSRVAPVVPVAIAIATDSPASMASNKSDRNTGRVVSIRALADAGAYVEAGRQAEELIAAQPACADAHYLLGLIRAAQGRSAEARRAFERAAYLDPHHEPALRHLALLLEAAGERGAALRLQRRAERVGSANP